MATNNRQLLVSLQAGATEPLPNPPSGGAVVINQNPPTQCTTKKTDAIVIDSNAFGDDNCADVEFVFVNSTDDTQILRFGPQGRAGVYQILDQPADASNVAGVTADVGEGAMPNVLPLQGFNFLGQNGVIITRVEVQINSNSPTQNGQKLTANRYSINVLDSAKRTTFKPLCSECFNDNDPITYSFPVCRAVDYYNNLEYPIVAGATITLKVTYAALATGLGYVACNGQYQGQLLPSA